MAAILPRRASFTSLLELDIGLLSSDRFHVDAGTEAFGGVVPKYTPTISISLLPILKIRLDPFRNFQAW